MNDDDQLQNKVYVNGITDTQGLKRHLNLCRNMPKDQSVKFKQEAALEDIDFSAVDENTCFCCLELKESAHVSTQSKM